MRNCGYGAASWGFSGNRPESRQLAACLPNSHTRQACARGPVLLAIQALDAHIFGQLARGFARSGRGLIQSMADYQFAQGAGTARAGDLAYDAGLRKFMLGVYNKLFLGILLAGALAYAAGAVEPITNLVFNTPLTFVVQWGPLVLLLGANFFMRANASPLATGLLYWSIVTLIGLGLGVWVHLADTATSARSGAIAVTTTYTTIGEAFFITASAFGVLSLWGYTSKKSLSAIGSFAVMALWGVVAFSVLN